MKNLSDQLKAIRIKPIKERPLVAARDHSVPVNDLGINKIPTPLEIYEYFNEPSNGVPMATSSNTEGLVNILENTGPSHPIYNKMAINKHLDYTHGPVRVFTDQEIKERNDAQK